MPYSYVSRTAYGTDAIDYGRGRGAGHNGMDARNIFVSAVNMLPDTVMPFEEQMQPLWDKADPRHKTQVDRFFISFGLEELDPDEPEDCFKALQIGREFALANAPGHQSAIFVQADGVGHKLHVHIYTNDVRISDHKGLKPESYAHWHFKNLVDEICEKYLGKPDWTAELAPERVSRAVRGARIANEQAREGNIREIERAREERRPVDRSRMRSAKYIWQDDLRGRIKAAAASAWDEDSFAGRLRADGVELIPHEDRKTGTTSYVHPATRTQPAHYKYELVDISGFDGPLPLTLRSKSFKLGANYQPEGIAKLFMESPPPEPEQEPIPRFLPGARSLAVIEAEQRGREAREEQERQEKEEREERTRQELAKAKQAMARAVWPAFAASMGWDAGRPDDPDEADRRRDLWLDECDRFQRWRVKYRSELKAKGKKLAPIYDTDKETGTISVIEENMLNQYSIYLYRKQQEDARAERDLEAETARRKLKEQQAALEAESRRGADPVAGDGGGRKDDREYDG